ncbi:AAA family ATPase [Deinococcus humi]|uniref:DNA-binding SARP family transcriptional activator n=1 Tax=Deinococcus humi TaxID=662880 RepID=A0A7W8JWQ6_9DEIO|nr:DNA-binding SARP family transcriptional activator [Deinococcus humi]
MLSTPLVHVALLGVPTVSGPSGAVTLDRKSAGVFALLAFEGSTPRSRVAGLLWPESKEHMARNSLVQLLKRWRRTLGEDLVVGGDVVRLKEGLTVDALQVQDALLLGHEEAFVAHHEDVLGAYMYDDLPEFHEWLAGERTRWRGWRRDALAALSDRDASRGAYEDALAWAEHLLRVDAACEDAFVRVLKLQYLLGDRDSALRTFARCEAVLWREHGVAPLRATLDLVRTIQGGRVLTPNTPSAQRVMPSSVLCPPILAGREREWALMDEAWARGTSIVISGVPGVGKSRLIKEFAASKGPFFNLDGRPGDTNVPYGTYARAWRRVLRARPDLELPDWVREQLALFLPEVWPTSEPPTPSRGNKERLFAAVGELALRVSRGMKCVIADDMQYYDPASMELGASIAQKYVPFDAHQGVVPMIAAHRAGELPSDVEAQLRGMLAAGLCIWIDLEPLDEHATTRVLASLNLPLVDVHAARLARSSGGNPLFLLEAVKHLLEHKGASSDESPLMPGKVQEVIGERLSRLSTKALLLAQAAAVLQTDFDLDLVSAVLDAPLLEVLPAWQELERAQILAEGRFSHDLVYESVRAGMSNSVRQALHRAAARALELHNGNPARTARHWLEGGAARRAVPNLREAARAACAALRFTEAAEALEQAAAILEANGELDAAFDMWAMLMTDVLRSGALTERCDSTMRHLTDLARTTRHRDALARLAAEQAGAPSPHETAR